MISGPIGIFDSGLGGLTVYREIRKVLPFEDIVYFGDTMRVPYGNKSTQTIREFSKQITEFLVSLGVKLIVVACNTVSANAMDSVKKTAGSIKVVGVIEPGVKDAVSATENKRIIVTGTRATVNSKAYSRFIHEIDSEITVKEIACPLFVPLVEEGFVSGRVAELVIEKYLGKFKKSYYDTLILGCTHYPLLKKTIKKVLPSVKIIDSSVSCAVTVKNLLEKEKLLNFKKRNGKSVFYVSDRPQNFVELSYRLTGIKICKINIKRF